MEFNREKKKQEFREKIKKEDALWDQKIEQLSRELRE